jgi:hypothetical protein
VTAVAFLVKARFLNGRGTASRAAETQPAVEKEDNFFGGFDCFLLGHPQLGQNKCVDSLV